MDMKTNPKQTSFIRIALEIIKESPESSLKLANMTRSLGIDPDDLYTQVRINSIRYAFDWGQLTDLQRQLHREACAIQKEKYVENKDYFPYTAALKLAQETVLKELNEQLIKDAKFLESNL
jgi:hypothetical protein